MRLVKLTHSTPEKIECEGKKIFICRCGLSNKFPYCDGSHKKTKDEKEGKLYIYDEEKRVEI